MSERLTIPDYRVANDDGSVTTRRSFIDGEKVREHAWELYKRLKQYEDACFDDPDKNTSREVITQNRLRELAEAEKDGRLVVLPVAEGGTAATPDGDAILNSWDIVARVTFCNEKRSHVYWKDKYADFDISDIKSKE